MDRLESAYEVSAVMHDGAVTRVLRGLARESGQTVILKTFRAAPTRRQAERLRHEYELLSRLDHPGIPRAIELMETAQALVLVEEDIGGERLIAVPQRGLPLDQFFAVAGPLVDAVGYLHGQRIVHRDLKPANVVVSAAGRVQLVDLGLATTLLREEADAGPLDQIIGTLPYLAPEQSGRVNRAVDHRADLYALGVTFYELLSGSLPFAATDALGWLHCHIARAPRPLVEAAPQVPGQVAAIVHRLLAKLAEDRYQSAAGLRVDLARCESEWRRDGAIGTFVLGADDRSDAFQLPHRLYGREPEVAALLAAFDRAVQGSRPELVLVAGYSGVGKSALVAELRTPVAERQGRFISGKFEQFERAVPYAPLAAAFRRLLEQILAESESGVAEWRDRLQAAVGEHGQVIVDLIPLAGTILGPQPPLVDLPQAQALHRARRVFRGFVDVFCAPQRPLVLFMDDLQWADPGSRMLIADLITHPDTRHLLVVGAYRENEVGASHPLRLMLAEIEQAAVPVQTVQLAPLGAADVANIVADTVRCRDQQSDALAALVFEKTRGNPFFCFQFLTALHRDNFIAWSDRTRAWSWDLAAIRERNFTDNVVELMLAEMARLPATAREVLALAGFMGNRFTAARIGLVSDASPDAVDAALWPAVQIGLVVGREGQYRFLHDRVQEAAYRLTDDGARAALHLRIGRTLLARTAAVDLDTDLFEIVGHFNAGSASIDSAAERRVLADLNLRAARRARAASAYTGAAAFALAGLDLLDADAWTRDYALTYALSLVRAECEHLSGRFDVADEILAAILAAAATPVDRAGARLVQIALRMTRGDNAGACESAQASLDDLGVSIPDRPTREQVEEAYAEIRRLSGNRSAEYLLELPAMTDPAMQMAVRTLVLVSTAAIFTEQRLWARQDAEMVLLALRFGHADTSVVAYVFYGFMLAGYLQQYQEGYRYCTVANTLMHRLGCTQHEGNLVYHQALVSLWVLPLADGLAMMRGSMASLMESGNLVIACLSRYFIVHFSFLKGSALGDVAEEVAQCQALAAQSRYRLVGSLNGATDRLVRALRDQPLHDAWTAPAAGQSREEHDRVERTPIVECTRRICELVEHFLLGRFDQAQAAAEAARPVLWSVMGLLPYPWYFYFGALTRAAVCAGASEAVRESHIAAIRAHEAQLAIWAAHNPGTFGHWQTLVQAELARVTGRMTDAVHLYERAVAEAEAGGYVHDAAIGCELTARFYRERGAERAAGAYVQAARDAYDRWGAHGKTRQLERELGEVASPPERRPDHTISTSTRHLDALAVTRASQAISGAIEQDALLRTLMLVMQAHACAQRGLLLMLSGDRLMRVATASGDDVDLATCDAADEREAPQAMLAYVRRTQERVLLDDARAPHAFANDPYFARVDPRSVLCLPILRQGALMGMLYLEHREITHVFAGARLAVLEQLAAQAAISLENAALYAELTRANRGLEAKVRKRTEALDAAHRELEAYAEHRYKSLVDALAQVVWTTDPHGEITEVFGLEHLAAVSDDDMMTRDWMERLAHPDDRETLTTVWAHAIATATPLSHEYRLVRGDGFVRQVQVRGVPVFARSGQVKEWVGVVTDVTEQRALEERMQQTRKMEALGKLAGGVAHDFNNLLTVIQGNASLVLEELTEDHSAREMIEDMMDAGDRAAGLTGHLLAFSRKSVASVQSVDLNEVVRVTVKMLQRLIGEDITLEYELGRRLRRVVADPVGLDQVLMNLLVNARDAMPVGGRISVRTENVVVTEGFAAEHASAQAGRHVRLSVADTGSGMSPATISQIFEPFFTTKAQGKGTGLGLSTVHGIVRQAGGFITVSSALGRGTVFEVYFPARRVSVSLARAVARTPSGLTGNETVLVAEDDPGVRRVALRTLRDAGYRVLEASSGAKALKLMFDFPGPIHLLITDVVMPDLGGRELSEQARRERPDIKVLFASGYMDDVIVRYGVTQATVQFLGKPYTPIDLRRAVRAALEDEPTRVAQ